MTESGSPLTRQRTTSRQSDSSAVMASSRESVCVCDGAVLVGIVKLWDELDMVIWEELDIVIWEELDSVISSSRHENIKTLVMTCCMQCMY